MPPVPATTLISDTDYDAIEAAVMETVRGRWFLAEYARRNRHAETERILEVLDRIEDRIQAPSKPLQIEGVQMNVLEMAQAIARTRAEIAALQPAAGLEAPFGEATEELGTIVSATERATGDILRTAEQIQELAWTQRENGSTCEVCHSLDAMATEIYASCAAQGLAGQRTRKVIDVLRYLEARTQSMLEVWGIDAEAVRAAANQSRLEAALAAAPALELSDEIVAIDVEESSLAPAAEPLMPVGDNQGTYEELVALDTAHTATVPLDPVSSEGDGRRMHVVVSAVEPASVRLTSAELDALSTTERVALFA